MFAKLRVNGAWSDLCIRILAASTVACLLLSVLDGVLRGPLEMAVVNAPLLKMMTYWTTDFRYVGEQGMVVSAILFVGAKFIETHTTWTIGFDRADGSKMALKGPDDDNVVWIGRRYESPAEAEVVAKAIAERMQEPQPSL